jgi:hypothetical protein
VIYDILGKARSFGITCKGKGHHITGHDDPVGVEAQVHSVYNLGATWPWVVNATTKYVHLYAE